MSLAAGPTVAFAEEGAAVQSVTPLQAATLYQAKSVKTDKYIKVSAGTEFVSDAPMPVSLVVNGKIVQVNTRDFQTTWDGKNFPTEAVKPGKHTVKVKAIYGEYAGQTWKMDYTVVAKSLQGAKVYEVNRDDLNDVSDTTFTFTGKIMNFGVALDGSPLTQGTDYRIERGSLTATEPGTYTLKIVGMGDYEGSVRNLKVTINKLDLSKAVVVANDVKASGPYDVVVKADGAEVDPRYYDLSFEGLTSDATDAVNWTNSKGQWKVTVTPKKSAEKYVTGTNSATFNAVEKIVAPSKFTYDGKQLKDMTFDQSKGQAFDASKIAVKGVDASSVKVSYVDENGKAVDNLSKAGTYTVTVSVVPGDDFAKGGSQSFQVKVLRGTIKANQAVTYKYGSDVVANYYGEFYNGSDFLKSLTVEVKDTKGNVLKQGEDFTLKVTDANGDVVDSIVNAGLYTIDIDAPGYTVKGQSSLTFQVLQRPVTPVAATDPVAYTGSAVSVPGVKYVSDVDADGNAVYTELPADLYDVVSIRSQKTGKIVDSAVEAGKYTVTIQLKDSAEDNYFLTNGSFDFEVKAYNPFEDVAPEAWYAKPVNQAAELGYVNGYAGTKLFGPNAQITRADAVCVLFNMAGGKEMADDMFAKNDKGYDTGFKDVAGSEYYAKALAWAHKAGVANGYADGSGNFGPNDQITREQFAALLANYAQLKGEYKAPTKDLSSYAGADTVSEWAKTVVAWAAENGVMGNNGASLAGQSTISRAEVAAMAVNYQPEAVKTPVKPIE